MKNITGQKNIQTLSLQHVIHSKNQKSLFGRSFSWIPGISLLSFLFLSFLILPAETNPESHYRVRSTQQQQVQQSQRATYNSTENRRQTQRSRRNQQVRRRTPRRQTRSRSPRRERSSIYQPRKQRNSRRRSVNRTRQVEPAQTRRPAPSAPAASSYQHVRQTSQPQIPRSLQNRKWKDPAQLQKTNANLTPRQRDYLEKTTISDVFVRSTKHMSVGVIGLMFLMFLALGLSQFIRSSYRSQPMASCIPDAKERNVLLQSVVITFGFLICTGLLVSFFFTIPASMNLIALLQPSASLEWTMLIFPVIAAIPGLFLSQRYYAKKMRKMEKQYYLLPKKK